MSISIVLPAYNEEKNIEKSAADIATFIKNIDQRYEIIIVDDGSTDSTPQIANRLCVANSKIRSMRHDKNLGYGAAVRTGIDASKYDFIFITDADGQYDITEFLKFFPYLTGFDMISGYRLNNQDPVERKVADALSGMAARSLLPCRLRDLTCSFTLLRRSMLSQITVNASSRLVFLEIACKLRSIGAAIKEVGINHFPRRDSFRPGTAVRAAASELKDLADIYKDLRARE